jgi:hypothetical protein
VKEIPEMFPSITNLQYIQLYKYILRHSELKENIVKTTRIYRYPN